MQISTMPVNIYQISTGVVFLRHDKLVLIMRTHNKLQGVVVPKGLRVVGYAHLASKYCLNIQVYVVSCVSEKHVRGSSVYKDNLRVFDKRYWPGDDDISHLVFALKNEGVHLLSLKLILDAIPLNDLIANIRTRPSGIHIRKIWFLYEWFNDVTLDVPACPKCKSIPLLDPKKYFTGETIYIKRQRLYNNLLGNRLFSPMIRKTQKLSEFIASDLSSKAADAIGTINKEVVDRAASFLLLADSKASFAIEGERVPINRVERWGKAVLQAGKFPLSNVEIIRLQKLIIKDLRFTRPGFRREGVFLGERDNEGNPLPEFIGAKPDDLDALVESMIHADEQLALSNLDPVLHAAAIAFGFVYIHPLEDGNGRLHRYLLHHVLASRKFSPQGFIFPVSTVMLQRIDEYRSVLRRHTLPLMDLIAWESTDRQNVKVVNDTRDLYSYYDCTEACEFLYSCVAETVNESLPKELRYLQSHDRAMRAISSRFDIPDNKTKMIIIFVLQNEGVFPARRRKGDFEKFTNNELDEIVSIINKAFIDVI